MRTAKRYKFKQETIVRLENRNYNILVMIYEFELIRSHATNLILL